jgi:hypothetical protein
MDRKKLEQDIAEFLATAPSQEDRLRLAATLLHQAANVLAIFGEYTRGAAEDALQAVLDTAEQMHTKIWGD